MADIDLPVFSFAPNWQGGITETLEWLTDVLRAALGDEQRRALRRTPRRIFEARFNPVGNERSFMSLWFQRFGEKSFLLPLWHDQAAITASVVAGGQRLAFDNTYREFEAGGLAILRHSVFNYEIVSIEGQDDDGIDLATGLAKAWPIGTKLYPIRVAELDDPSLDYSAIVDRVGDASVAFRLIRENPYTNDGETLALYAGHPVMVTPPNRADDLRVRFERLHEDVDNQTGLPYRRDEAGRAFASQPHDWRARGRQQHHELRQALYRLNGRQKAVWMPTWNQDVVLARNLVAGANRIDIGKIGYGYLGGPSSGREHIMLTDDAGGKQIVKVTGTGIAIDEDEERLNLSANVGFGAAAGTAGSFVELMRLDQDSIEITHYTDSEGVCDAAAAFRAFRGTRDPSGPLVVPATVANMTGGICGEPAPDEESPCLQYYVFEGWHYKAIISMPGNDTVSNSGNLICAMANAENSYGTSGGFVYDTDGEFIPNGLSQKHVVNPGLVIAYFVGDPSVLGPPTELYLQLQRNGAPTGNTITFQSWNSPGGLLTTRQSQLYNPGANSAGGNGNTGFIGAGLFPQGYYFGV